jgi:hypothetical protein
MGGKGNKELLYSLTAPLWGNGKWRENMYSKVSIRETYFYQESK